MKRPLLSLIYILTFLWVHAKAHAVPSPISRPSYKAILVLPTGPTAVSVSPTAICAGESISLAATCSLGTITWYNQSTGGTALGTGSGLSQSPVVNTTYYASCVDGIEESERIATTIVKVNKPRITATKNLLSYAAITAFENINVRSTSFPTLIDLDSDGLLDMIIGEQNGTLVHYKQAAINSMNFTLVTNTFNNIDVGDVASPTFTDLDGDGLLDLIIGRYAGTLVHYEQASLNSLTFNLVTTTFSGINLGEVFAKPVFTDLDGDGLLDLIVSKLDGNLNHYEQASANSLTFNLITNSFLNINFGGQKIPTFTDLDNDGLLDFIIASGISYAHYEQAVANSLSFNPVANTFSNISIIPSINSTFIDIDSDGLLDMICGTIGGTLQAYEQIPGSFTPFLASIGNPSSTQSILVWGGSCLSSNINITVPAGFEVSLSSGSGFASSISLIPVNGSVSNTTIYVRFNPSIDGVITGDLQINATNANAVSFALKGCTPSTPPTGTSNATVCASTTASLTATCASGTVSWYNSSTGYLMGTGSPFTTSILSSNTSYSVRCEGCNVSSFVNVMVEVIPPVNGAFDITSKAICSGTSTSLSAQCTSGTVKWYDSDGTILLFTGVPFVTPTLNTNTTYKVGCEYRSCPSALTDCNIIMIANPTDTSNSTICYNTRASLLANCAGSSVKWYDANGTVLQATNSPFLTPELVSNTTYKVRCESPDVNCFSDFVAIAVAVNPIVPTPTGTANPTICAGTSTSLAAICSSGSVKWYNSGGTALQGTGSPFITPNLNSITTYKVRCETGGAPDCASAFVNVIVTTNPAVPAGTANTTICYNTSTSLSANCNSSSVKWYDAAGTSLLSTGSPFITPNLSSTTLYKVRCESGGSPNCISAFTDVTVTVNPVVATPTGTTNVTICNNTSTTLSANCSGNSVKWYDATGTVLQGTDSPFTTPMLTSTTIYKVRCETGGTPDCASNFVAVTVTVNPVVAAPAGTADMIICVNSNASLSASCTGSIPKWYDATGTSLQETGSSFVTPNLNSNTTYKVRCETGGEPDCASTFVDVTVTISPMVSNPTAVSVSSTAICSGTTISLSATCALGTVKWYNQQTGGTTIGTTSPLIQSPLTNTIYYVSCANGACESARVATNQVFVTTQPTDPTGVSISSTTICLGSSISLSATCAIGNIIWYNQQTGGTAIGTGNNFSQSPTTHTRYYVSCKNGTCETNRLATNLVYVGTLSTSLNLTSDISSGINVQIATQTIAATNKVNSPANVVYKAGKSIALNPGFEAQSGSIFKAYIGGCSD